MNIHVSFITTVQAIHEILWQPHLTGRKDVLNGQIKIITPSQTLSSDERINEHYMGIIYVSKLLIFLSHFDSPSSSFDSPLCSSITPSFFHSRLKTCFTNPTPVVSLFPPGLPSRTIAWTVSSELLGSFLCRVPD